MKVRFFEPGLSYKKIKSTILSVFDRVLSNGDLIMREDMETFEKEMAKYLGVRYFVGVNSGTDALYIALRAAGIGKGDEVITVSHTFIATIEAIVRCGATPILVDINENWLMDMDQVRKAVTPNTRAILPVHLSGDMCDMDALIDIVKDTDIKIIEDAAQALGSKWGDKMAGSIGLAGCFSFYPAKILGCYGDGGGIATNDDHIYNECKLLRNHYNVKQTGLQSDAAPQEMEWVGNSRLDNIQAAVLRIKLDILPRTLIERWTIANHYNTKLADIPNITLPPNRVGRVWQDYVIKVMNARERELLKDFLDERGIETLGHGLIPNHHYNFKENNLKKCVLPKTEEYTYEFVRLPCNENLTLEETDYVIRAIRDFYGVI